MGGQVDPGRPRLVRWTCENGEETRILEIAAHVPRSVTENIHYTAFSLRKEKEAFRSVRNFKKGSLQFEKRKVNDSRPKNIAKTCKPWTHLHIDMHMVIFIF